MTPSGTAAYDGVVGLPPLVQQAVELARAAGFAYSCLPQQGELLRLLAGGVGPGLIDETGTGYGVGLAWLAGGAHPQARLVSVERDPERAAAATSVFRDRSGVQVRTGHWRELQAFAPFNLLVLDGGGQGKGEEPPLDPADWLVPGGLLVIDDVSPLTGWPPIYDGRVDTARQHWLDHPRLRATQINTTPEQATILATYLGDEPPAGSSRAVRRGGPGSGLDATSGPVQERFRSRDRPELSHCVHSAIGVQRPSRG